jgi:hypothetical protein
LQAWAEESHVASGFPLLGTDHRAELYVALQWNGERAARAGLGLPDLVVLTGLVTGWQEDRTVVELETAVGRALGMRAGTVSAALDTGAPVTADVVTTAVCAGVLGGVPEEELALLVDVAGTLLQVYPDGVATLEGTGDHTGWIAARSTAAGHTAAAGWLAVQVHLAGLVAYPGAFADTLATATVPLAELEPATRVRAFVAGLG